MFVSEQRDVCSVTALSAFKKFLMANILAALLDANREKKQLGHQAPAKKEGTLAVGEKRALTGSCRHCKAKPAC